MPVLLRWSIVGFSQYTSVAIFISIPFRIGLLQERLGLFVGDRRGALQRGCEGFFFLCCETDRKLRSLAKRRDKHGYRMLQNKSKQGDRREIIMNCHPHHLLRWSLNSWSLQGILKQWGYGYTSFWGQVGLEWGLKPTTTRNPFLDKVFLFF